MDNGLIFPDPCMRAHGESVILTALKHTWQPFGLLCVDAWGLIW